MVSESKPLLQVGDLFKTWDNKGNLVGIVTKVEPHPEVDFVYHFQQVSGTFQYYPHFSHRSYYAFNSVVVHNSKVSKLLYASRD